ncbi:MAG: acyloxyacyl hydrolase, partial [Bacteroidota bacterium]
MATVLTCFLYLSNMQAQVPEPRTEPHHGIGFMMGYGSQNGLNTRYRYQVRFFQFQYYYRLLQKESWQLELLAQPQYNVTHVRPIDYMPNEVSGFEYGINIGLLIRKPLFNEFLSVYAALSLGPHYVSETPRRQTNGFIFSDNLFLGVNIKLTNRLFLDLRPGFRHLSNAGLKRPNFGINNLVFSSGFWV